MLKHVFTKDEVETMKAELLQDGWNEVVEDIDRHSLWAIAVDKAIELGVWKNCKIVINYGELSATFELIGEVCDGN